MSGLVGRLRYFTGKEATSHPKMSANLPTWMTFPTRIRLDLAKLAFKPETAQIRERDSANTATWRNEHHGKSKCRQQTKDARKKHYPL